MKLSYRKGEKVRIFSLMNAIYRDEEGKGKDLPHELVAKVVGLYLGKQIEHKKLLGCGKFTFLPGVKLTYFLEAWIEDLKASKPGRRMILDD